VFIRFVDPRDHSATQAHARALYNAAAKPSLRTYAVRAGLLIPAVDLEGSGILGSALRRNGGSLLVRCLDAAEDQGQVVEHRRLLDADST